MAKFFKKELKIIQALMQGKDLTEIIITFNTDSDEVERIAAKYRKIKKGAPKQFSISDNCDILYNDRVINSCRELTGGPRHNKPWLGIEKKCLVCLIKQNEVNDKSSLTKLCKDVSEYFDRDWKAIYQMAYKLIKNSTGKV